MDQRAPLRFEGPSRLVEGEEVLSRVSPSSKTTEELTESLADLLAGLLVAGLPRSIVPGSYEWEVFVATLSGVFFEWSFWRPKQASAQEAAAALAGPLAEALAKELVRLRDTYETVPLEERLVTAAPRAHEVRTIARVFVEELDSSPRGYEATIALIPRLQAKLRELQRTGWRGV